MLLNIIVTTCETRLRSVAHQHSLQQPCRTPPHGNFFQEAQKLEPVCAVFITLTINFFSGKKFMWKEGLQRMKTNLTADGTREILKKSGP
jgi:hypothetical protein